MKGIVLLFLLTLSIAIPAASQDKPDFSGTWVRDTATDAFILERSTIGVVATGAATWEEYAHGIRSLRSYTVIIEQTPGKLDLQFPAAFGVMNQIPYQLDGEEHATVQDSSTFRGMWTKFITKAVWSGSSLTVQGTAFSDFYTHADPSTVAKEPEHGGFRNPAVAHMLRSDPIDSRLTITTTISDEKGEAVFRQTFHRAPGR